MAMMLAGLNPAALFAYQQSISIHIYIYNIDICIYIHDPCLYKETMELVWWR